MRADGWGEEVVLEEYWMAARVSTVLGLATCVFDTTCRVPKIVDDLAMLIVNRAGATTLTEDEAQLLEIVKRGPDAVRAELAARTLESLP